MLLALTMSTLLMFAGLAVDAGRLFVERRTMQEAADAGAYAGAVVLYQGGSQADAVAAATADVSRNGYVHGGNGGLTSVLVYAPPQTGVYAGNPRYVEVVIETLVSTQLLPSQLDRVKVRGVGGAEPLNNAYAIMALDRGNTAAAMNVAANGIVNVDGAGIQINSTNAAAADNQGTGNITVSPPYGTTVTGGYYGQWPNPVSGAPQRPDPFAGYPRPNTSGMPVYNALPAPVNNVITIDPGVYNVPIQAAGGTTIRMNSGIYVTRAGINGSGNADVQSGAGGVFIFNTISTYPNGGGTCASVRLTGNAQSTLAPLATGTYAGLLIYQDPACTAQLVIAGNGTLTASGTIYLPTAAFTMNGNNATLSGSQLVASRVDVQNGKISITFNASTTAQPVLPRLSE